MDGTMFFRNCIKGFACLAIAFFAMANKPCFADLSGYSFGCVDYSGNSSIVHDTENYNLFDIISLGASSVQSSTYNSSVFRVALGSMGLSDYFYNWDVYSPSFYVNVYCSDNFSGYTNYYLDFRKTTYSDISFDSLVMADRVLFSNTSAFPCVRNDAANRTYFFGSFPKNFYVGLNSLAFSDKFYLIGDFNSSSNMSYGGITYPLSVHSYWNTGHDFSSEFSSFLSDDDSYSFTVRFCVNNTSRNFYFIFSGLNVGLYTGTIRYECIFSSFFVYPLSSSVSLGNGSDNFSDYFTFMLSSDFDFSALFDTSVPWTVGLVFDWRNPDIPSPTPIPPWRDSELPTPTAYPSVTVAPLPTGIVTDYIPLLDLPSTENTLANITGIIKEFNSIFSRKVFSLGSYTLQVMYYFSGWFKFIFLVPAGVFIAFLIGRLRKK